MGNSIEREQDPACPSPAPVPAPGCEAQIPATEERSRQQGDSLCSVHFQLGCVSELGEAFQEESKAEGDFDYRAGTLQGRGKEFGEGGSGTRKPSTYEE